MTITLELPDELERELSAEAARRGVPMQECAVRLLSAAILPTPQITDGKSAVEYWEREGLIGWRPEITDPAAYARSLRDEAERRSAGESR